MASKDNWQTATALSKRITDSSSISYWERDTFAAGIQTWQIDALSKLIAICAGEDITYLSSAIDDQLQGRLVAFTDKSLITVDVTTDFASRVTRSDVSRVARSGLTRLDLDTVARVTSSAVGWPSNIGVTAYFGPVSFTLPLDKYASERNHAEFVAFLPSLVNDLEA